MLDSVTGAIARKDAGAVVLRAGGVGFRLMVPRRTIEAMPEEGEATLYCHLAIRDESVKLFGFASIFERELFQKLNSVAGIGGVTALHVLSEFSPQEIVAAIAADNSARFLKVKGIGAKTAKRIVLELKGKVEELAGAAERDSARPAGGAALPDDLAAALAALGYPRALARDVSIRVLADHPGEEDLEKLLRAALSVIKS